MLKPDFLGLNSGSAGDMLSGPGHVPQPLCAPFLPVPSPRMTVGMKMPLGHGKCF